jgi:hypothetical protein
MQHLRAEESALVTSYGDVRNRGGVRDTDVGN